MYYKKLAYTIMEAGKPKICSVVPQARDPEKLMVQFQSIYTLLESSLLIAKARLFVLFNPSMDWMRPILMDLGFKSTV